VPSLALGEEALSRVPEQGTRGRLKKKPTRPYLNLTGHPPASTPHAARQQSPARTRRLCSRSRSRRRPHAPPLLALPLARLHTPAPPRPGPPPPAARPQTPPAGPLRRRPPCPSGGQAPDAARPAPPAARPRTLPAWPLRRLGPRRRPPANTRPGSADARPPQELPGPRRLTPNLTCDSSQVLIFLTPADDLLQFVAKFQALYRICRVDAVLCLLCQCKAFVGWML